MFIEIRGNVLQYNWDLLMDGLRWLTKSFLRIKRSISWANCMENHQEDILVSATL
jgi:hypothetical protein